MKDLLIIFTLFSITSINMYAQEDSKSLKYTVLALGKDVGEFIVNQKLDNEGILYTENITDIKIKMLMSYQINYTLQTTHKNGKLIESHIQTKKNSKINSDTWLLANANNYLLIKDNDTTLINDGITYTGSLLYFNEPINIKHVYKEKSGEKRLIKSIGNHKYALLDSNGETTHEYTYENGIIISAKIKNTIADIYLEYRN